ncbi:hypothetical protein ICN10_10040 [Polynucleobacter sp. 86C-FISCH]|uniref:hypothetical protein n=1 Tax=Polynucleobacter sp. 86C-FISCH TaxID=2689101 RepID=UPI001C0B6276|nr:hypothetical protein [Polynucleobacter sp. 86C-FISCH]MBU3596738.1 hypothetical protein [Polynucleobacter sp. 86C-FISCH]
MQRIQKTVLFFASVFGLTVFAPSITQAGNIGWAISAGSGFGSWQPAAYDPWGGWGGNYDGPAYGYPYGAGFYSPLVVYVAPPVIAYSSPPQPMILAARAQPTSLVFLPSEWPIFSVCTKLHFWLANSTCNAAS